MGNLISAILMSVLEAAWVLQRYLDQDYRQNHGSRLLPLEDLKSDMEASPEVILPEGACTPVFSRSPHHRSKPVRFYHQKTRSDPVVSRKTIHYGHGRPNHLKHTRAASMHVQSPQKDQTLFARAERDEREDLLCGCSTNLTDEQVNDTTRAWVRRHAGPCTEGPFLRRAFSEINLRPTRSGSPLRLVVLQGCAPHRKHDFKICADF